MIKIGENERWSGEYNPENNIMYNRWHGPTTGSSEPILIDSFDQITAFAQSNNVNGGVSDIRNVEGSFTNITDHITGVVIPAWVAAGITRIAQVLAADVFTSFSADKYTEQEVHGTPLVIRNYDADEYDDAVSWVEQAG